ncbi:MAG TPA: SapC family protein [Steroidobacteraceae bacterium]|nr:SapC family protein [Steroidobacteraceae bacterium]
MTQIATLSNDAHRSLRVDRRPSAAYGDSQPFCQVIVGEFAHLVVRYPLLFSKDAATGELYCGVLLGYDKGENLFLEEWREGQGYRPLLLQRAPFLTYGRYLAIDLDHPRVGVEAGEPLFTDDGRPTPYLESIKEAVRYLHSGMLATKVFVTRLLELRLIEPIDLEVELDDGSSRDGVGLYTIDAGALGALDDATVVELHRRGYLRLIDFMIASLKQLPVLTSRKNARLLRSTEALARMQPCGHG